MRSIMLPALVAALVLHAAPGGAAATDAQPRVRIADEPVCPRCRIALTRVVRLGGPGDPAGVETSASVVRDSRGRYYAGPNDVDGRVNVYDAAGRFVRTLGRPGRGPGELFRVSELAMAPGDSLHVFDFGNLRQTVFTPDGRVARTVHVPGTVYTAIPRPNGEVIAQFHVPSASLAGYTVHRLDRNGRFLRSFAELRRGYRRSDWTASFRPMAPAADGGVWVAYPNRYEIELWSADGRLRRTLVRDASWFRPWSAESNRDPRRQRPPPGIVGIRQDAAGRLWVSMRIADPRWTREPPRREGEEGRILPAEAGRLFDTLFEVIDPAGGRLIARAHNPGPPLAFIADDLVYRIVEREDGSFGADVLRVQLNQR
jgi:hypothetical protein